MLSAIERLPAGSRRPRPVLLGPAVMVFAAALVLAGCTGKNNTSTAPSSSPTAAQAGGATRLSGVQTQASPAASAASPQPASGQSSSGQSSGASSGSSAQASSVAFPSAIRQVSQQVRPAVVQITNEQVQPGAFNQGTTVPAGVGSGVIYDNQGHILTNAHVVSGAQSLRVSLPDGRSFTGKLLGADTQTDLAVVQISGNNLPVAPLGQSSQLNVGDWVVAIGNALALQGGPTVTQGVVSAVGRTVQEPPPENGGSGGSGGNGGGLGGFGGPGGGGQAAGPFLFDVIQTDAPINPGNSGGPLINLSGQVVGINTLGATQAEPGVPAQGIGFAIAIDTAKPIADQLVATGKVVHPYLGIGYVPLNPDIAAMAGVDAKNGDYLLQVDPGSPADQAGLKQGDVITQVNGKDLQGDSALAEALNNDKPGDQVTLTVLRGNQTQQVKVTLGQAPSQSGG